LCKAFIVTFGVDEVSEQVKEIRNKYKEEPVKNICSCGREFKLKEPIFCPKCQNFNVQYEINYIT